MSVHGFMGHLFSPDQDAIHTHPHYIAINIVYASMIMEMVKKHNAKGVTTMFRLTGFVVCAIIIILLYGQKLRSLRPYIISLLSPEYDLQSESHCFLHEIWTCSHQLLLRMLGIMSCYHGQLSENHRLSYLGQSRIIQPWCNRERYRHSQNNI